jgi:hypothetical protein
LTGRRRGGFEHRSIVIGFWELRLGLSAPCDFTATAAIWASVAVLSMSPRDQGEDARKRQVQRPPATAEA